MRKWTIWAFISILFLPAYARGQRRNQQQTSFTVPDRVVTVPEGQFLFTDLVVGPCSEFGGPAISNYMQGRVVNQTNRTWKHLFFDMPATYSDGQQLPIGLMIFDDAFKPGESRPLDRTSKCGLSVTILQSRQLQSWDIVMKGGWYEAYYKLALTKATSPGTLTFADNRIAAEFIAAEKSMQFALKNLTEGVLRVDWDQAAFVDWTGQSHTVCHNGVKFADRTNPKTPTVIPPGARIEDAIISNDSISFGSRQWNIENFLPVGRAATALRDKQFSIYLPLIQDGKTLDYTFTFKIIDVTF